MYGFIKFGYGVNGRSIQFISIMEHNVSVSFVCQRCLQPLSLDPSFNQIGEHRKAELSCKYFKINLLTRANINRCFWFFSSWITVPLFTTPEAPLDSQVESFNQFAPPFNLVDSANESSGFTMLEDGDISNLSHHIKVSLPKCSSNDRSNRIFSF